MSKIILICGKICSGKTHYVKAIKAQNRAVLLSCDEIEAQVFQHSLGDRHDAVAGSIKGYLHQKAVEIALAGCDVILDWGFWGGAEREAVSAFYRRQGIPYEWHYIDISDADWQRNIQSRNAAVSAGETADYAVDAGLLKKLTTLFEPPDKREMHVWHQNRRL